MSNSTPPIPKAKRGRRSDSEIEDDRLSNLSDCILLHILSFLNAKHAVQTCMLSKRWGNLWKCLQTLILRSRNFSSLKSFTKFVSKILTLRDGSIALHKLYLERHGSIEPHIIKKILNYAVSHNVQRLGIRVEFDMLHLLPCNFTCRTLTSLKLQIHRKSGGCSLLPISLNLPVLTYLHLENFAFCSSCGNAPAEPFSAFNRLNSLIINSCKVEDSTTLFICSTTLVNLTLCDLRGEIGRIELYTPCLRSFACRGFPIQYITGIGLSFVQEANIHAYIQEDSNFSPLILLRWLRDLANIRSLTVTTNTLEVLSSNPDLLKMNPLSWANLKRLKIKLKAMFSKTLMVRTAAPLPDGIVDFLIQNSPSAQVEIVDCSTDFQLFEEGFKDMDELWFA